MAKFLVKDPRGILSCPRCGNENLTKSGKRFNGGRVPVEEFVCSKNPGHNFLIPIGTTTEAK